MKKNILSMIATCLLIAYTSYAQENKSFEGTIRMAVSMNMDKMTGSVNKAADVNSGNKLADVIAKKVVKKYLGGVNETLASINGDYEFLIKVKGNKIVQFNTQDGSMLLFDCDKGEIYMTYPFAEAALKYTVAEYKQLMASIKFNIEILQDNVQELGGYQCKKAVVSGKMNGKETNYSEYWYTDEVVLPECFLDIFHRPGLVIVENTKIMNNPLYGLVTKVEEMEVPSDVFIIPAGYEIFTPKDYMKFSKKLSKASKNKKTYTVGSKIPDVFWDF